MRSEIIRLRDANIFSRVRIHQAPARFREDSMEEKAAYRFIITGSAALLQWRRYLNYPRYSLNS